MSDLSQVPPLKSVTDDPVSRELAAAAPRARYLELAGEDHLSLPLRLDRLGGTVTAWFDHTQASGTATCPMPEPPRA